MSLNNSYDKLNEYFNSEELRICFLELHFNYILLSVFLLQMRRLRVTYVIVHLAALDNWHTINRRNGILGKPFL
jgi:hypothetical protein